MAMFADCIVNEEKENNFWFMYVCVCMQACVSVQIGDVHICVYVHIWACMWVTDIDTMCLFQFLST